MKRLPPKNILTPITAGVLSLFLGTITTAYAQHDPPANDAEQQQQQQASPLTRQRQVPPVRQQAMTVTRQQHVEPVKQQQQAAQVKQQQQSNRPSLQGRRVQQSEQPVVWQQHRAQNWQSEHRTWQQRGGYTGYRIPQSDFHAHFGRSHGFRMNDQPLVIFERYPSFQDGGFWFSLIDPWPETWPGDWYENDDLYLDYADDGYYLYDRRHPGHGIAVNVSMD